MLKFIQDNAVFCTCIVGIFSAIMSAFVTLAVNRRTEKSKYIRELKEDIKEAKCDLQKAQERIKEVEQELEKYHSIEYAERNIDKTNGSVYREVLPDGSIRYICGLCWEKDHIKTPIVIKRFYDGSLGANCEVCKGYCDEKGLDL